MFRCGDGFEDVCYGAGILVWNEGVFRCGDEFENGDRFRNITFNMHSDIITLI